MWEDELEGSVLAPLNITCTSSDCGNGLHCFKATADLRKRNRAGVCRDCEADLIDWARVQQRELGDIQHTFQALKNEMVRHHYWHVEINQRAVNHALRKGRLALRDFAGKRLQQSIGKAENFREGYQTPRYDSAGATNVVYFAQHATATCCRACVEYWHGIPKGRAMSDEELDYLTELVMLYVNERVPNLTEEKQSVSSIRPATGRHDGATH